MPQRYSAKPEYSEIIARIGFGAFGFVFQVKSRADPSCIYVVKEGNFYKFTGSPKALGISFPEGDIMKSLSHPNIVKVFDIWVKEEGDVVRLAMEYCDGGTLETAIQCQKGKPFQEEKIKSWFVQLVQGLLYLHEKQILHRNIKPGNVLLSDNGCVAKLGHFKVTRDYGRRDAYSFVNISEDYTKCDTWALGVLTYQLMALDSMPFEQTEKIPAVPVSTAKPLSTSFSVELRELVENRLLNRNLTEQPTMSEIIMLPFLKRISERNAEELLQLVEKGDLAGISEALAIVPHSKLVDPATWRNTANNRLHETPLHIAARHDQVAALELLWPCICDLVELENFEKFPVLHVAAENNAIKSVDFILGKSKLLLETKEVISGRTALHISCANGFVELVKLLVEKYEADVNAKSNKSDNESLPVHLATYYGHFAVVKYLLEKYPDFINVICHDNRLIDFAALGGNLEVVDYFIEGHHVDVNLRNNSHGRTPLHNAASKGHLNVAKTLIEKHHADVYAKSNANDFESLPIHLAAHFGRLPVVKYFLEKYPDLLFAQDVNGQSLIHKAALGNSAEVVDYLANEHNVDVNTHNENYGRTPLHNAAERGYLELAKTLIEKHHADAYAKSNARDNEELPIHLAAWQGRLAVFKYLAEKYPDSINVKNRNGETPLHLATKSGKLNEAPQIVSWFKSRKL